MGDAAAPVEDFVKRRSEEASDLGRNAGREARRFGTNLENESLAAGRNLGLNDTLTQILFPLSIGAAGREKQEMGDKQAKTETAQRQQVQQNEQTIESEQSRLRNQVDQARRAAARRGPRTTILTSPLGGAINQPTGPRTLLGG